MTGGPVLAFGGTNFTAMAISLGIVFSGLAEEAMASQRELRTQLAELRAKAATVEQLMRVSDDRQIGRCG